MDNYFSMHHLYIYPFLNDYSHDVYTKRLYYNKYNATISLCHTRNACDFAFLRNCDKYVRTSSCNNM